LGLVNASNGGSPPFVPFGESFLMPKESNSGVVPNASGFL
jgi:hypothetical protein